MIEKGRKCLPLQVRTNNGNGKLLFEWHPYDSTVILVVKGYKYRVKLSSNSYQILEQRPKGQCGNQ